MIVIFQFEMGFLDEDGRNAFFEHKRNLIWHLEYDIK